jgi:hypothetical protein
MASKSYTPQETNELINAIMKEKGDAFRVTVRKRDPLNGTAQSVAIFKDVPVEHIGTAEIWLRDLAGGGEYWLTVAHETESFAQIGGILNPRVGGPPMPTNPNAPTAPDWRGPVNVFWIEDKPLPVKQAGAPAPAPAQERIEVPPPTRHNAVDALGLEAAAVGAEREKLHGWTRDVSVKEVEVKSREAEADRKIKESAAEVARVRQEAEKMIADARVNAERQLALVAQQAPRTAPLMELIPALTPIAIAYFQSQKERAIEAAKLRTAEAAAEREREARREERQAQMQAKSEERFEKIIAENRAATDKLLAELHAKQPQDASTKEMFGSMAVGFAQMAQTTMSMVTTATELQPKAEAPGVDWVALATGVSRNLADMFRSYTQVQLKAAGIPVPPQLQTPAPAPEAAKPAEPEPEPEPTPPEGFDDSGPVLAQIVEKVKRNQATTEVASAFLNATDNNAWFRFKVQKAESLVDVFGATLGDWVMENVAERGPYVDACAKAIEAASARRARA